MSIIQILFSGKGRIRRSTYWLYSICFGVVMLLLEFAGHQLITGNPPAQFFTDLAGWVALKPAPFNLFLIAMMIIGQWPGICISAKRWHDRGKTGWMAGFTVVASMIMSFTQIYFGPTGTHVNWPIYGSSAFIGLAIGIWVFVECGCLDGTQGPNRYGPSPKGIGGAANVF